MVTVNGNRASSIGTISLDFLEHLTSMIFYLDVFLQRILPCIMHQQVSLSDQSLKNSVHSVCGGGSLFGLR